MPQLPLDRNIFLIAHNPVCKLQASYITELDSMDYKSNISFTQHFQEKNWIFFAGFAFLFISCK